MTFPFARSVGGKGLADYKAYLHPHVSIINPSARVFQSGIHIQKSLADPAKLRYVHIVSEKLSLRYASDVRILCACPPSRLTFIQAY